MDWDQRESRRVIYTEHPGSLTAGFQDEGANSVVIVYIMLSLPLGRSCLWVVPLPHRFLTFMRSMACALCAVHLITEHSVLLEGLIVG